MMMTEYETTMLFRPDLGGDAIEGTLDRVRSVVKDGGGKLLAINHWGRKKLAYEINKQTRGVYVHTHYLGAQNLVAELERNLRISDNIMRFLTVRMEEDVDPKDRSEKAYVKPEYGAIDESSEMETSGEQRHMGYEPAEQEEMEDEGHRRRDDE